MVFYFVELIFGLRTQRVGIATLIRSSMMTLTDMADYADNSSEGYQKARDALRNKIKTLDDVRQELHKSELRFIDALTVSD